MQIGKSMLYTFPYILLSLSVLIYVFGHMSSIKGKFFRLVNSASGAEILNEYHML